MMPTLVLTDRSEKLITPEQAKGITQAIENKEEFITINGFPLKLSSISRIEPRGQTEADIPKSHQLEAPSQPSISGSLKDKLKNERPEVYRKLYGKL